MVVYHLICIGLGYMGLSEIFCPSPRPENQCRSKSTPQNA
jgi:hypothetical protein